MAGPGRAGFAGTELVEAAASLFHNGPRWQGEEGRAFLLSVSAGTVGLTLRDTARLERNSLNGFWHETRGTRQVIAPERHRRKDEHGVPYGAVVDAGGIVYDDDDEWTLREPAPARQVEGWSRRSRARMVRRLAQLDWTPMYAAGRDAVMVTLTYPGSWLELAPTGQAVKDHHHALMKRWARRWHECSEACRWEARRGRKVSAAPTKGRGASTRVRWVRVHVWQEPAHPWKLEFQRRGAPHLHLMVVPPRDPDFPAWLSQAWAEVVGSRSDRDRNGYLLELGYGKPGETERTAHVAAGTGVDRLRGGRCFDPKRAAVYFSKHGGAAGGKEYQNTVPVEWQEPGAGPGRFWGYRGLVPVVASVGVDVAEYVKLRRTLRRWSKAQGMTRTVRVPRVDAATGVVRWRTVTRSRVLLGYGGLAGGTVLVNDGPAFASALARLPALQHAPAGER